MHAWPKLHRKTTTAYNQITKEKKTKKKRKKTLEPRAEQLVIPDILHASKRRGKRLSARTCRPVRPGRPPPTKSRGEDQELRAKPRTRGRLKLRAAQKEGEGGGGGGGEGRVEIRESPQCVYIHMPLSPSLFRFPRRTTYPPPLSFAFGFVDASGRERAVSSPPANRSGNAERQSEREREREREREAGRERILRSGREK